MLNRNLIEAAREGRTETVRELLAKGAEINYADQGDCKALITDKDGCTALIWAACNGRTETVRELLAQGAWVKHVNHFGDSALTYAVNYGYTEMVKIIDAKLAEHETYERRKKEIGLFFLRGKEKTVLSILGLGKEKEVKPTKDIPEDIVNIINDYARPAGIPAPTRKK